MKIPVAEAWKARFLIPYVIIVFLNLIVQVTGAALLLNLGNAMYHTHHSQQRHESV